MGKNKSETEKREALQKIESLIGTDAITDDDLDKIGSDEERRKWNQELAEADRGDFYGPEGGWYASRSC